MIVVPVGQLGVGTYGQLRDHLIKVGADGPRAVVVDLTELGVEAGGSLGVFVTVQTRLREWPGVPLLLVTGTAAARNMVTRNRTDHFLPVHDSVVDAIAAIDEPRRVARLALPNELTSPRVAREFTRATCRQWHCAGLSDEAALLVGELVTNAVVHTVSPPALRLELRRELFSVAVYDDLPGEVSLREPGGLHGLLLVTRVASAWGCTPTLAGGKVVWATLRLGDSVEQD